jgi:hypothetical protein
MSLKSLTVTHDPEEGCSKCVFCDHEYNLCQQYNRLADNLEDPAPSWCPFREVQETAVTREAVLREAAEMVCSTCCFDMVPPQRKVFPSARWEHADGDTCPAGAIWEQIAKEHTP